MEHYFKGENVEYEEVLDPDLSSVLPPDPTWIRVKPGSKIPNLLGPASASLKDKGIVLISGSGAAVTKVSDYVFFPLPCLKLNWCIQISSIV